MYQTYLQEILGIDIFYYAESTLDEDNHINYEDKPNFNG